MEISVGILWFLYLLFSTVFFVILYFVFPKDTVNISLSLLIALLSGALIVFSLIPFTRELDRDERRWFGVLVTVIFVFPTLVLIWLFIYWETGICRKEIKMVCDKNNVCRPVEGRIVCDGEVTRVYWE